jgi:hypothetical protein
MMTDQMPCKESLRNCNAAPMPCGTEWTSEESKVTEKLFPGGIVIGFEYSVNYRLMPFGWQYEKHAVGLPGIKVIDRDITGKI